MVTLILAGLALAAPQEFSLETRYMSAFGPDAWGSLHLRAEAADGLDVGVLAIGGTRSALLASARKELRLVDLVSWRSELLLGMRRTAVDEQGGPLGGFQSTLSVRAARSVHGVAGGGWLPGLGGWFETGVDGGLSDAVSVHPRLHLSTWAGDRDLAVRAELGLSHRWSSGFFVRGAVGAGGRDTIHMGPSAALSFGRML